MTIEKLTPDNYTTSVWSGGTTTQLMIYPKTACYSERNFLFRISSATVETDHSLFTSLPGFTRYITPLNDSLQLVHRDHRSLLLHPLEIDCFQGEWHTEGFGKVTDFNLMVASVCRGSMTARSVNGKEMIRIEANTHYLGYLYQGALTTRIGATQFSLNAGEALYIRTDTTEQLSLFSDSSCSLVWCSIADKKDTYIPD